LCRDKCQTLPSGPILIHNIILNLNVSAFRQNIKNLVGNFGAINVGNMHASFQPSSFNGVGGEEVTERRTVGQGASRHIANFPFALLGKHHHCKKI